MIPAVFQRAMVHHWTREKGMQEALLPCHDTLTLRDTASYSSPVTPHHFPRQHVRDLGVSFLMHLPSLISSCYMPVVHFLLHIILETSQKSFLFSFSLFGLPCL